jgi:hypothetical protein
MKYLVLVVLLLTNILADDLYNKLKGQKIFEDFNIQEFNKRSVNGQEYSYTDKDGVYIDINTGLNSAFIKRKTYPNSLLYEYRAYDKNGKIKYYLLEINFSEFSNSGYKIKETFFNKQGNITKNIDYDKDYKLQFDDIIKMLKKDYSYIDLDYVDEIIDNEVEYDRYILEDIKEYKKEIFKYELKPIVFNILTKNLSLPIGIYHITYYTHNPDPYEAFFQNNLLLNGNTGEAVLFYRLKWEIAG